ncbi:MAG: diacylglycerol/lipid kinase family protein [Anaerolineae bacterium]
MLKTLFVVNLNAGRVRRTWHQIEPQLKTWVSNYRVVMTRFPEDVVACLDQSAVDGVERVISVGGDGTNKFMVSALMSHQQTYPDHPLIFGCIPAGTGRDFARGVGLPLDSLVAADYVLHHATPHLIDVGMATFGAERHYFLNAANAGIAYDVAQRAERSPKRPWTFLKAVIASLLRYQPDAVRIELDGQFWFEGNIYVMAVANGRSIGQGILIAPDAEVDDGAFDVVIAEQMPFLSLVRAFPTIYAGTHINHPRVQVQRASHVRITTPHGGAIGMDLDGEPSEGAPEITYQILPATLNMLL